MTFEEAKQILQALENKGVRYVLIGSMAMAVHGLVRATRDMDFFVSADQDNVQRLKDALMSVFNDPSVTEISSEDLQGDYPAIQYAPPVGDYSIDILSRLGENYTYEDIESEKVSLGSFEVRVATPNMLYRMKRNTVRLQDKADAAALKQKFELDEEI